MNRVALAFLSSFTLAVVASRDATAQQAVASLTLRADWFDRANIRVSLPGEIYADEHACIWNAGVLPNRAEYDVEFPVTAEYALVALYTAAGSRPVDIYVDGAKVHRGFASITGSWQTSSARWERQCKIRIAAGRHTIKLECPGPCMPHIVAVRFESPVAFPPHWKLDRPAAKRRTHAPERQSRGHLIPEQPILASADRDVRFEVLRVGELEFSGAAAHDELLQRSVGERFVPRTPWVARLSSASSPDRAVLELDPARLRGRLENAIRLVDDFRTMRDVKPTYLAARRARCEDLLARLGDVVELADGKSKWEAYCALHLEGSGLEHDIALRNPRLDFDRLLLVQRAAHGPALGLPQNWQSNCVLPARGYDDEIAVLSPLRSDGRLATLWKPKGPHFVGDVDLHFDADRMLFSSIGANGMWHVFEIGADGTGLRQLTPNEPGVNHYDACYLPDERIVFSSTASVAAVPCVNGSTNVANLYLMNADGTGIRQLCFDQEHNWCPTVLPSGKVLYQRWEYTDTPHSHDRLLFTMNPDGTGQAEFYGSNSYWPNSLFYARPIPERPNRFVGIVSGHHGVRRMGELVLFDAARGRREAEGAVQRVPGHGERVESTSDPRHESSLIQDNLVDNSWPKFLHPYPLSDKYFLVAAKLEPRSLWGIYLVDVFDNMVLIRDEPGHALLEPLPLRRTPTPPVIPDRVDLARDDAEVHLLDIYAGGGLEGIPRGTVKKLRLFSYHYLFPGMGGPQGVVGMEGPWDIKRIVGTVPVRPDGSASFRIPANTPIALQPLDAEGKALQLMRSWLTGMPGEVVSCVGCHESPNSSPTSSPHTAPSLVAAHDLDEIEPWYGPARGFNFEREVQPVLDRYCVGCHDGNTDTGDRKAFDLRGLEKITDYTSVYHFGGRDAGHFSTSYVELHRFVRRPGLESDYHMLMPMEFHADTTQLVQLLEKGHYGVELDDEAWDRLITWIDLNAPYHGTWTEIAGAQRVEPLAERRRELLARYANVDSDPEVEARPSGPSGPPILPIVPAKQTSPAVASVDCPDWPFDAAEAERRRASLGVSETRRVQLAEGIAMELMLVPAGEFVLGDTRGDAHAYPDERPATRVEIDAPFWIGRLEVTNEQYRLFDPRHDSRVESRFGMQFGVRGFYVNHPERPVVRISWQRAMDFCAWLSETTGERFTLPTEAQWEYACRAGTDTEFSFGDRNADFSRFANLADRTLSEFVCHPYKKHREPYPNPSKYDDWIPKDTRFDDDGFLSEEGGQWQPNAWGIADLHGNVAEWTRSLYRAYPYVDGDGRNDPNAPGKRVVRGGSWRDRPQRARSSFRLAYRPYQGVYNVGFRVVCAVSAGGTK